MPSGNEPPESPETGTEPDEDATTISKQQWRGRPSRMAPTWTRARSSRSAPASPSSSPSWADKLRRRRARRDRPTPSACAIGAFIGGRLATSWAANGSTSGPADLRFGVLLIALAVDPAMLFAGTFIVGVPCADVPTSLALSASSPRQGTGRWWG